MSGDSKVDLRQLFHLPIRQIVVADETEGLSNMVEEQRQNSDCPMVYQAVSLNKVMGSRMQEDGEIQALDYANGFDLIEPDKELSESLLTQMLHDPSEPDKCEFLAVVSMYNEGSEHFKNTMCGIANNLKTFVNFGVHPKKIGVCVIIDGLGPFFKTIKGEDNSYNSTFFHQFFDENMIKERFGVEDCEKCALPESNKNGELGHIFMQNVVMDDKRMFPLQLFFTIKQQNKSKLNSHLWFFGGFCELIQPRYVLLMDVGTQPMENSLFHMYEALQLNPNLAGCCGEIRPMGQNMWKLVIPAQEVEYKLAHVFDKALESVVGYITALPSAFSAYRWEALQGSPLWDEYFRSICHPEEMGPFMSNIFLAEDRVLCLALVSKKNSKYTLRYVRSAVAETDIPQTLAQLMSQRRRWINGSWFALVNSLKNFSKVHKSAHSCCRRTLFMFMMIYYYFSIMSSWFMVGMFYVMFAITIDTEFGNKLASIGNWLMLVYMVLLIVSFTMALSVKPRLVNDLYKGISVVYGLYMGIAAYLLILYVFIGLGSGDSVDNCRYMIFGAMFLTGVTILANKCCGVVFKGLGHYMFMLPTYVNVFLCYAICNTHDCSWGSRPAANQEVNNRKEEFEEFRARWCIFWVLSNGIFGFIIKTLSNESEGTDKVYFVYLIASFAAVFMFFKVVGGLIHICIEKKNDRKASKIEEDDLYHPGNKKADEKSVLSSFAKTYNASRTATSKGKNTNYDSKKFTSDYLSEEPESFVEDDSQLNSQGNSDQISDDYDDSQSLEEMIDSEEAEEDLEESHGVTNLLDSQSLSQSNLEDSQELDEDSQALDEDTQRDYAEMIRNARDELDMSYSYLAQEMDISLERLKEIEAGEVDPEPDEAERILEVLEDD